MRFKFVYFDEYILPGDTFLFREGRAKGTPQNTLIIIICRGKLMNRSWQSSAKGISYFYSIERR